MAEEGQSLEASGVVAHDGPTHDSAGPAEPDADPAHSPAHSPNKSPSAELQAGDRAGGRDSKTVVDAALRRADGLLASRVIGEMAAEAARKQALPLPSVDPTRPHSSRSFVLPPGARAGDRRGGGGGEARVRAGRAALACVRRGDRGAPTPIAQRRSSTMRTVGRRADALWRARSRRRRRRALRRRNGGS